MANRSQQLNRQSLSSICSRTRDFIILNGFPVASFPLMWLKRRWKRKICSSFCSGKPRIPLSSTRIVSLHTGSVQTDTWRYNASSSSARDPNDLKVRVSTGVPSLIPARVPVSLTRTSASHRFEMSANSRKTCLLKSHCIGLILIIKSNSVSIGDSKRCE